MGARRLGLFTTLLCGVLGLSSGLGATEAPPQLNKFLGCWMSSKAFGVIVTTDAFKPDGYSLLQEFTAVSIEPIEDEGFVNVVKGTLDVWSEGDKYYIPTIYYGGVYDPVRDAILTDSVFYVVGDQLFFVHDRTTDKSSDRSFRILDRTDCAALEEKRAAVHRAYKPFNSP